MTPTFGRYELLKRLAGGGMGEVYLARQRGIEGFQKLLVIKTLLPHLCEDEELITMFKDEARVTAQLIHPNICQVFEFDQASGVYYMAMEYLRGDDLRRLWRACEARGLPLRVPLVCRIVADAAAGLDFAHSLHAQDGSPYGIVHRDISPQNIFVTFEGGVKIIDFGVAKAAGRAQHTRSGMLKGKSSYMSPEQAEGERLDNRSDIFALGIVLHELLTGRRLFKADSDLETLARVRDCVVAPPSRLNPQLPHGLDDIVLKALAKNPDERYRTAQEFRLALEEWLIQGRMSASSAHLAEFLKVLYAERLEKEARFGPLLGEPGLSGAPPGLQTPTTVPLPPPRVADGTLNQRFGRSTTPPQLDPTIVHTGTGTSRSRNTMRVTLGALVAAMIVAATFALRAPAKPLAKPAPPPVAQAAIAPAPQTFTVHLRIDPRGTEIYEGAKQLGTSPLTWSATKGAHELSFHHAGYRDATGAVHVTHDGEDFTFKALTRVAPKKHTPELDIKGER